MDELGRFCIRMLGHGPAAHAAAETASAGAGAGADRATELRAAWLACLQAASATPAAGGDDRDPELAADRGVGGLAAAVAGELASAAELLTVKERAVLALRDLLGLGYDEIAVVTGVQEESVAPVLAGARLRLREVLRGRGMPPPECPEHERALRTIAARQDEQPVAAADEDWLIEHLGHCRDCARVHVAMLEATACYQAWGAAESAAATAAP